MLILHNLAIIIQNLSENVLGPPYTNLIKKIGIRSVLPFYKNPLGAWKKVVRVNNPIVCLGCELCTGGGLPRLTFGKGGGGDRKI